MNKTPHPDGLEERFSEPTGWRWHHVKRPDPNYKNPNDPSKNGERRLRFGCVSPADSIPDGVVVCLPGLSEFCEKYFEVARNCLDKNLAFWVIDWMGQGQSDRYLPNMQKRHSVGFDHDVDDLHEFVMGYIKHSSVHPDKGRIPLIMLGHSMGANIGLQYLSKHPDIFECAAFSAPMLGIAAVNNSVPRALQAPVSWLLKTMAGTSYVADGRDWASDMRPKQEQSAFSHDKMRDCVHTAWCEHDASLQVGSPTYAWLYHALKSCRALKRSDIRATIETPCLIASAGADSIVDNAATLDLVMELKSVQHIDLDNSYHEILMEDDAYRDQFFKYLYALIDENIIQRPETLKPF